MGRLIARALSKEPHFGYVVIGFIDDDPSRIGTYIDNIKVHKGIDQDTFLCQARQRDRALHRAADGRPGKGSGD